MSDPPKCEEPKGEPAAAAPAADGAAPEKSKAQMRRERAAKQEAERAAKKVLKEQAERDKASGKAPTAAAEKKKEAPKAKKPKPEQPAEGGKEKKKKKKDKVSLDDLHPAVLRLGEQYRDFTVVGGNARCVALLMCMREVATTMRDTPASGRRSNIASDPLDSTAAPAAPAPDSTTASIKELTSQLNKSVSYLTSCRPHSYSMGSGIKFMKSKLQQCLERQMSREEAFNEFIGAVDDFIDEVVMADKLIAEECLKPSHPHIRDGDVILTYGRSNAIEWTFRLAKDRGVKFEVITVDSRPMNEGQQFATTLAGLGIPTRYCLISSLSSPLLACNKVFVGAATMLTNGSLVSRSGTAMICMMAKTVSKPVIAFCETYKFTDQVWLGSLTHNERADATPLLKFANGKESPLAGVLADAEEEEASVRLVNFMYDLTPAESIDIVVTEIGSVHPNAVPVILRERAS